MISPEDKLPSIKDLQPQEFDAIFDTFHEWAKARKSEEYISSAKEPTVPFAPLSREIDVSIIEETELLDITPEFQQEISKWVGKVKQPFDLIQRAEGQELPAMVYYGSQNSAVKNIDGNTDRAIVRSSAGRAGVRRQYRTTNMHYEIAKDRSERLVPALVRLKDGEDLNTDDLSLMQDVLQELANGLAANLDSNYKGGDLEARIAGESIKNLAKKIQDGTVDASEYKILLYACSGYIKKQEKLWFRKLSRIYNFAQREGFHVESSDEEVV